MAKTKERLEQAVRWARLIGAGCVDPRTGLLLLDYSLSRLSPADELEFEAHLLACDHCFDALRGLDQIESILRAFVDLDVEPDPTAPWSRA
jgi:anti-sigma factor RsiW